MTQVFVLEMMTVADYGRYLSGSNNYSVSTIKVEAESKEEAINKVKIEYPTMAINTKWIKTVEEIEEEKRAKKEYWAEVERKNAEKKARNIAKEEAKAKEMGLTLEEYKAYKKEEAKKRRYAREIVAMEEQIEEIKRKIEYRKNYLNK